jgi:hypothetical protein
MKTLLLPIAWLILTIILASACTKRVDIPLKTGDIKLSVEGYLFDTDSISWVRLTKTSGYFSDEPPPAVSKAQVTVAYNSRQWPLTESDTAPGLYFIEDSSFRLVAGDTYSLQILLPAPIGGYSRYESQTTVPPLRIHIDSLNMEYAPVFKQWVVRYFGQDMPGRDYYLFNSQVNGKIVTDSILQKTVREDRFFDGRYVSGVVVQVLKQNKLKPGDIYTLMASNITKEYYEYLQALQDEIGEKNPLFSGPPANVTGNINHGALGFFTAFFTTAYEVRLKKLESGK